MKDVLSCDPHDLSSDSYSSYEIGWKRYEGVQQGVLHRGYPNGEKADERSKAVRGLRVNHPGKSREV